VDAFVEIQRRCGRKLSRMKDAAVSLEFSWRETNDWI
jgi:hypothetical protein